MQDEIEPRVAEVLEAIGNLPGQWHQVGSVSPTVLRRIAWHLRGRRLACTMETGSGKTTLLFSHLSQRHLVFAINDYAGFDTESISKVRASPFFQAGRVEFVEGPTQLTLPRYSFSEPLQAALIDGPHGYPFPELEYYYIYPQLEPGALLIVDDIHIPTVGRLFEFLREDEMFTLLEVVETTAFLRRTDAPTFSPVLDDWWKQNYNKRRFQPPQAAARGAPRFQWLRRALPAPIKRILRRVIRRP